MNTIQLFSIATKTWNTISYTGSFTARRLHVATLYNNDVYVIGGCTSSSEIPLNDVVKFTIATSTWSPISYTGTFPARWFHSVTLVNGDIYIIGGYNGYGTHFNDIRKFNIATSIWTDVGYTGTFSAREGHSATLYNNLIYVIGGNYGSSSNKNDVLTFNIATSVWTNIVYSGTFSARWAHTATLYNDAIYVIGGRIGTGTSNYNDVLMFILATNTWVTISPIGSYTPRGIHDTVLYNNIIYFMDGSYANTAVLSDMYQMSLPLQGNNAILLLYTTSLSLIT